MRWRHPSEQRQWSGDDLRSAWGHDRQNSRWAQRVRFAPESGLRCIHCWCRKSAKSRHSEFNTLLLL